MGRPGARIEGNWLRLAGSVGLRTGLTRRMSQVRDKGRRQSNPRTTFGPPQRDLSHPEPKLLAALRVTCPPARLPPRLLVRLSRFVLLLSLSRDLAVAYFSYCFDADSNQL